MQDTTTYRGADVGALFKLDKLSDAVAAIIEAADHLDRDDYLPYSGEWHAPLYDSTGEERQDVCLVCDAGAVLAHVGLDRNAELHAGDGDGEVPRDVFRVMTAFDSIRTGEWNSAAEDLGIRLTGAQQAQLLAINAPQQPSWSPEYLSTGRTFGDEHRKALWENFNAHITDLRHRVLPQLRDMGL